MTIYQPLRSTNDETQFRLCSLLPAAFHDPLKCTLEVVDLNIEPQFEALSYAWGDPTDQIAIEVNGETMPVTRNLATALTYLRESSDPRSLWIDGICINQEDNAERSMQVARMRDIYSAAQRVVSWLGVRDPLCDPFDEIRWATLLFKHIRHLKEHPPARAYLESNGLVPYAELENDKKKLECGLYSLQLLIGERERQKPAYWQRAWITQEVASAATLILQSGHFVISEEDIELVTEFLNSPTAELLMDWRYEPRKLRSRFRSESFIPVSIYRSLLSLGGEDKTQWTARMRGPLKLLHLLRHNRSRLCVDAKDKVYSVLGLSDLANSDHPGILIDYNKSIAQVYTGAVQAMIQSSSTLEVLCSTNLAESTNPILPSWVPNWAASRSSEACDRPISYHHLKATGTTRADFRFFSDGSMHILSAAGFCIGSVASLIDPFLKLSEDWVDQKAETLRATYASLYPLLSGAYKAMAKLLHPRPLSPDLFRHTCSLGLLHHDLNDGFWEFMTGLELSADPDQTCGPQVNFPKSYYRLRTMASSIDGQCMFGIQYDPSKESSQLADGAIGIAAPGVVEKGDLICLLLGCSTPLILRQVERRYKVVCAAYVENLMDGSAMEDLERGSFTLSTFELE
jgi:Heterokaryon incompatibility protein (HET)